MRILVLAPQPFYEVRGTPIAVRALAESLVARGHEVDLLTFGLGRDVAIPGCRILRAARPPGVRRLRPGFSPGKLACDLVLLAAAVRLAGRRRYDLVHAVEESVFVALLLRRLYGVPYVYDMDSSLPEQMLDRFRWLGPVAGALWACERVAVRGSAGVLAVCRSLAELARGWSADVPVGVAEDFSLLGEPVPPRDAGPLRARVGARGPVVLYVGNLEPYQGIDLLLEGFACAARVRPELALAVVGGDPPSVARYAARAAALGLGGRVRFLGPRPLGELGSWLASADVLVSPRLGGRNTPMKIYSYLAAGRPLLATRLPTHTQVLDDEVACLVAAEPDALAAGLLRLVADPEWAARLAARARALARREFSRAAYEAKVNRFYDVVEARLGGRQPAAVRVV